MEKLSKILSLLILCVFCTSKVKAQEEISYNFDIKKNYIKVTFSIPGSASGITHLKLPVIFELDMTYLQKLQICIDGLRYKYTTNNNLIILRHKPSALLQISYQLYNMRQYDSNLHFYITPKFFFFPIKACLLEPVFTSHEPYNISFHFNTYNGKIFSNIPHTRGHFEFAVTTAKELEDGFFIGGEVADYRINNSNSTVFFSKEITLSKQQVVDYISRVESLHNNFFGQTNKKSYFIFLLNPKYKKDIEGSSISSLNIIAVGKEVQFNYELQRVIAHENLHRWFNSKVFGQYPDKQGYNCWFIEGFTDYYTDYLNSKLNVITLNDYLVNYNKILANYYTSPFRYLTNSEIGQATNDEEIFSIAYWRGAIIAHELNFLLQNISKKYDNKLNLDSYVRYLIQVRNSSNNSFNFDILVKTLFDFTGNDFSKYIDDIRQNLILVSAQSILSNKALLILKETEEILYDFDFPKSRLQWLIQGVNFSSEAFGSGLRNGQQIINITTTTQGDVFFTVTDKKGIRKIKVPQKTRKVLIPQYKLKSDSVPGNEMFYD